jgi:hypothetical protein
MEDGQWNREATWLLARTGTALETKTGLELTVTTTAARAMVGRFKVRNSLDLDSETALLAWSR